MAELPAHLLDAVYVAIPALDVLHVDGGAVLANRVLCTEAPLTDELRAVVDAFARPQTVASVAGMKGIQPRAIVAAMESGFIMKLDVLLSASSPAIGHAMPMSAFLDAAPRVAIFGAPIDSAAGGAAGARHGPDEIRAATRLPLWGDERTSDRVASSFGAPAKKGDAVFLDLDYRRTYAGEPPAVVDLGNLTIMPGESIQSYGARIALVTSLVLDRGACPAMLGGDHSTSWFVLDLLLRRHPKLGIIHFDAHPDLVPPFAGMDYLTHAMPFGKLLRHDSLAVLFQLGLRVFERAGRADLVEDPRVTYVSARELQRRSPTEVFATLPRDIPYYLSFDVDCIDPRYAPETGTPVAGGLSPYQAADLVDHAARELDLVGWDIVEVGPRSTTTNGAAATAAMLVKQLLLGKMKWSPLTTYVPRP